MDALRLALIIRMTYMLEFWHAALEPATNSRSIDYESVDVCVHTRTRMLVTIATADFFSSKNERRKRIDRERERERTSLSLSSLEK